MKYFDNYNQLNSIIYKRRLKRRVKKRRRGKHLYSLFLSRKKKYSLYYQPFDSKLVKKNLGSNFKASYSSLMRSRFKIGLKATKLNLIRIICLKGLKFCSQRYLRSLYIEKYFRFNISVFPDYWLTSKPKSVRMGKGKGALKFKVFFLKKGSDIYNMKYLFKLNNYILNQKLYIFKFNIFIWFLMKILKAKPTVKNVIYKKIY